MKIARLRIGQIPPETLQLQNLRYAQISTEQYWAEVIEDGKKFYYRVNGTAVEMTRSEFDKVIANPFLYYFSTALKLHLRVERARGEL